MQKLISSEKCSKMLLQVKSDSSLIALQPHIGGDEFLQCNERLRYTDFLPYDTQYTILLPRKNWITKLMLKFYHEKIIMHAE